MNEHTPLIGVAKYGKDDVEKALDGGSNNNNNSNNTCSSPKKQHIAKIGMISSLALFVNELTGPGMLDFPATFQRCGFIPTSAVIIVTAALSAVCALNMANVISIVPNNTDFSQEVEYSATFRYYVGNTVFLATELVFFVAIMCQMIASIADTAQVVDSFLGNHIGTFGLRVSPGPLEFHGWNAAVACAGEIVDVSSDRDQNSVVPCLAFDDEDEYGQFVLTAGYVLSAIIFIPIGRLDLEGNMFWQEIAFYVLLFCSAQFIGSFLMNGIDFNNLPMWGEEPDEGEGRWDGLIGVVLFNFAIVTAVPSWLYEKSPTVNVEQAVRVSCIISSFLYIAVGALGALAIPNVPSNVLTALSSGELGPVTTLFSSVFTFFIIGFGIPLFRCVFNCFCIYTCDL